jgi:hypothetical protein
VPGCVNEARKWGDCAGNYVVVGAFDRFRFSADDNHIGKTKGVNYFMKKLHPSLKGFYQGNLELRFSKGDDDSR